MKKLFFTAICLIWAMPGVILADVFQADPPEGKQVYEKVCRTCHHWGISGAPKVGDPEAWKNRIPKGIYILYDHAIHGYKAMPPKGGDSGLTDKQVKAAVDYMVQRSKQK